jgi:hypothetical protein
MFLKRLFGSKTDARSLVDQAQLIETALNAADSAARRNACREIVDLATLHQIADADADAGVRELATARYRKLLCGQHEHAPSLQARIAELAGIEDQTLLAAVAADGDDAELRLAAIMALQSEEALAERALHDPLASNRLQAAERLRGKQALERVARGIGKRDKRVYRLTKQRLKHINEQEERPRLVHAQCETLCEKIERLGRFEHWEQDHALLIHLDQQWAEIESEVGTEQRARYQRLRQTFLDAYAANAREYAAQLAEHSAQQQARTRREALIGDLDEVRQLQTLDLLDQRLGEIEREWDQLGGDPAGLAAAFSRALSTAHDQRDRLDQQRRQLDAAAALLKEAKAALKRGGNLERRQVNALRERLARLNAEGGIIDQCNQALEALQQRLDKQREQIERKLAALPQRLAELDQHFEQGQLKKAEPLYQSIDATMQRAHAIGLANKELAAAEAHLKGIAPQLRELQRWRRWGADNRREQLCGEIEALAADQQHPLEPMSNRLRELQNDWRNLDHNGAPADDALWRRFHGAAEQVHARCQPFLEAQAKIRAANRAQREALCTQLETFLEQVDWERMDWKKACRAEREMRQAWAALGPIDNRSHRNLEGRFRKALRRLDKALDDERAANTALKQHLVERMQALADEPDLGRAIDAAKALQQQWHTTVPGRQRDENVLWSSFRAASDAVFNRRAAQHEARSAELHDNQAVRESLCAELETLPASAEDANSLQEAVNRLETRWHDTDALALPRQAAQALQRRWRDALRAAGERLQALEDAERWATISRLEQRAAFCDSAARRLMADADGADADTLRGQWAALPELQSRDLAEPLGAAFERLIDAVESAAARTELERRMRENAERRQQLCLHLEISSGAESPPELKQQRMELQVSRLRERLGERGNERADEGAEASVADPVAEAWKLLQDWYLCTPAAEIDGLDARFERAKQAMMGRQPTPEAA